MVSPRQCYRSRVPGSKSPRVYLIVHRGFHVLRLLGHVPSTYLRNTSWQSLLSLRPISDTHGLRRAKRQTSRAFFLASTRSLAMAQLTPCEPCLLLPMPVTPSAVIIRDADGWVRPRSLSPEAARPVPRMMVPSLRDEMKGAPRLGCCLSALNEMSLSSTRLLALATGRPGL